MTKKILIVDDDQITVKYLDALFSDNGYETMIASDGVEAEKAVKEVKPDLITLDLEMPREWGPRFYQKMIKMPGYDEIPVIVISGLSNSKHSINKAIAILNKPFDSDKLLGIVKRTIG